MLTIKETRKTFSNSLFLSVFVNLIESLNQIYLFIYLFIYFNLTTINNILQ